MIQITTIILIAVAAYICVEGVSYIARGKPLAGGKSEERWSQKYTPESVKKYYRVSGVFFIILGLAIIAYDLRDVLHIFDGVNMLLVMGIIVIVCLVLVFVLRATVPKKRTAGDTYTSAGSTYAGAGRRAKKDDEYIDED